jgi:hypothetical protein
MKNNKNFRKDDLSPESNTKKIYKMYKRKKQWVVAPVVFAMLLNAASPVAALAVSDVEQTEAATTQVRAVDDELQKLIEQAEMNINALVSLTPEAKTTYITAIKGADDKAEVEAQLLEAYKEDVAEATKAVEASYSGQIDVLASLSADQKTQIKTTITNALNLEALKTTFNGIMNSNDYATFKGAFDQQLAKNKEAANALVEDAVALNNALADLPNYRLEQKAVINGLSQLQGIEKQGLHTAIDKADDKAAIDAVVAGAKSENQTRLAAAIIDKVAVLKAETAKITGLNASKETELNAKIDTAAVTNDEAALAALNALTAEVEKAVADVIANDLQGQLNTAKSNLKATISTDKKNNELITAADVSAFNSKVDAAKTLDAVNAVKAEWEDFVEVTNIKGKDIDAARTKAEELINELTTMDPILNAQYLQNVALAQTPEAVAAVVASAQADERKAKEKNAAEIEAAKEQAVKEINALGNLTKAEKKAKTDAVEAATEKSVIADLVKAAKEADATKALLAEQKAAKDKIDALEYLSVGAKATAKANVDLATDSAGITKVLNEAIYDNYQAGVINAEVELDEAKTIAKEAVGKLENLTTTQKNAALNDITAAKDKAAVTNVLNAAKELDQQNAEAKEAAKTLEKAKEDAKAVIDALKYLTQEVKNGYKAEVTNAKDIPAVTAIETRAKNEDADIKATEVALETSKQDLVTIINGSDKLTAADKLSLIAQTIECRSEAEVLALKGKVNQLILDRTVEAAEGATAKAEIKAAIDQLDELSPKQKNEYKAKVDKADKKADMVAVYNEAKAESNRIFDQKIINDITKLLASGSYVEAQKEINKLRTDSTRKEYQAKLDNSIALAAAKAEANKQIDALENLSIEEKAKAKEKISKLTTTEAVDKEVAALVKADNLAHDKDLIEMATLQIKVKDFEAAAKTIEKIRDPETKAKLQKQLEDAQKVAPTIKAQGHVSKIGWQKNVGMNEIIGTTGRKLALEAVKIDLADVEMPEGAKKLEGGIEYRAHVRNIGWQKYVSNGTLAGTTGKSLQMEAIQIKLTGELAEKYNVEYRAHVKDIGWQKYVSNGTIAGTTGKSLRMEAVQIRLVEKK